MGVRVIPIHTQRQRDERRGRNSTFCNFEIPDQRALDTQPRLRLFPGELHDPPRLDDFRYASRPRFRSRDFRRIRR